MSSQPSKTTLPLRRGSTPQAGGGSYPDKGNLPQLRFPEFKDAGAWSITELKDVACFVSDKVSLNSVSLANYVSTENLLPDYEGIVIASKLPTTGSVTQYAVNDILISNIRPYLKKVWFANQGGGASNDVIVVRAKDDVLATYLSFILRNDAFIDYVMKGAKGVKMPRGDIALMKAYRIAYPQKQEQQKIAVCLTSLDDLITTENQQLEALKTHKKGLMQSLFPAEGETVPRFRFPEFKDAGAWEEKNLGDIGSVKMCKRILKEQTLPVGDVPFYKIGTFGSTPDAFIAKELFKVYKNKFSFPKKGAVLISASGTIGRTVRYQGEDAYYQDSNIVWLEHGNEFVTDDFLFYLYQLITWKPSVGAIQRLYNETILCTKIKFPSLPEQQKIAACLSSLDDLISAQSQKIEALKQHKKGLMQQLFPNVVSKVGIADQFREGTKLIEQECH